MSSGFSFQFNIRIMRQCNNSEQILISELKKEVKKHTNLKAFVSIQQNRDNLLMQTKQCRRLIIMKFSPFSSFKSISDSQYNSLRGHLVGVIWRRMDKCKEKIGRILVLRVVWLGGGRGVIMVGLMCFLPGSTKIASPLDLGRKWGEERVQTGNYPSTVQHLFF